MLTRFFSISLICLNLFPILHLCTTWKAQAASFSKDVALTILHTNDLHSHFKSETHPFPRGGLARLKTAIQQVQKTRPHSILVDGGDWSEGSIYYTNNGGADTTSLMEQMGYELAVVGNHDFLNGPDLLIHAIAGANSRRLKFLAANLSAEGYSREDDLNQFILPYVIKTYQDRRVAFIGLTTYEFIYDKFFSPVEIQEPLFSTRDLAAKLKTEGADGIVVISHNGSWVNQKLLEIAPEIDLVIGAHDHIQYNSPKIIDGGLRSRPGWLVETGKWGRNLGQVEVLLSDGEMKLISGGLIQIDEKFHEDPIILGKIQQIEKSIEQHMGPIFSDHVGDSDVRIADGHGNETPLTHLITDAYLDYAHADFALENHKFVYGEINPGPITTANIFDLNPAIFNPSTHKSWTLKVLPIQGRVLKWLLYLAYGTKKLGSAGLFDASGLTFKHDPLFAASYDGSDDLRIPQPEDPYELQRLFEAPTTAGANLEIEAFPVVQDIQIQGTPLDPDQTYQMATGGGLIESFEFINKYIYNFISLEDAVDTGVENWRITLNYIKKMGRLHKDNTQHRNRIRTIQSDLGIHESEITWSTNFKTNKEWSGRVTAKVTNVGTQTFSSTSESSPRASIFLNRNAYALNQDPEYVRLGEPQSIPKLTPGASILIQWPNIMVPRLNKPFPITIKIEGADYEVNPNNNEVTTWINI